MFKKLLYNVFNICVAIIAFVLLGLFVHWTLKDTEIQQIGYIEAEDVKVYIGVSYDVDYKHALYLYSKLRTESKLKANIGYVHDGFRSLADATDILKLGNKYLVEIGTDDEITISTFQ